MKLVLAVLTLSSIGSLGPIAQQLHAIPVEAANVDGNGSTWLPGCGDSGAKQVLIAARHLQPLVGRTIVGMAFRRDASWLAALPASDAAVALRIGACASDPDAPAADFATNLPQPIEVFRGLTSMLPMPPITGYQGWVAPHVFEITFTTPFLYSGGPLGIEIDGLSTTPRAYFPMDEVCEELRGNIVDIGVACGPRVAELRNTAAVISTGLTPGGTAQIHLLGSEGNAAFAFFGVSLLPQPVNLTLIGAPGCQWYVDACTALAAPVVASGIPAVDGLASVRLHLPGTPTLLGGQLVVQWLEVGTGSLATSQALALTISAQMPTLCMAQLERLSDGSVHVAPASGPVIGFRWL
ncbi:MAG: hypothetical protein HZB39_06295 [Planctomycetes bacterium]|nr:hypothetical protein [Planctomycetota bacterium]